MPSSGSGGRGGASAEEGDQVPKLHLEQQPHFGEYLPRPLQRLQVAAGEADCGGLQHEQVDEDAPLVLLCRHAGAIIVVPTDPMCKNTTFRLEWKRDSSREKSGGGGDLRGERRLWREGW